MTAAFSSVPRLIRISSAALIGYIAWNGHIAGLALSPLIFYSWARARTRYEAFAIAFAYYWLASRGLLLGGAVFFAKADGEPVWWIGLVLWSLQSTLLATAWAIAWTPEFDIRPTLLRVVLLIIVLAVPPLGIFGWASPLTAAGALFPGTRWFGLLLMLPLFCALASKSARIRLYVCTLLAAVSLPLQFQSSLPQSAWRGIDTELGELNQPATYERLQTLQSIVRKESAESPRGTVLVFPELVAGDWSANAAWWTRVSNELAAREQTVLLGAARTGSSASTKDVNMLVAIGSGAGLEFYDRMPVPFSMWKPWAKSGFEAFWFDDQVQRLHGERVAPLICYEQLLIWPVLSSMAERPTIIVGAANGWWAKDTSIPRIQVEATNAWAKLFNLPVVYARNR